MRKSKTSLKDPSGGLTAAGRAAYRKKTGARLKPGVKGAADTPDKMRRKGSFLRRHYATLRGPLVDARGNPTRLALQAHAWGEPVPKTQAAATRLAAKGERLLERYAKSKSKGKRQGKTIPKGAAKKPAPAKTKSKTKAKAGKPTRAVAKTKAKAKAKPGLYANIAKAKVRAAHGGRPVRKKGKPGAPTEQAFKAAAKTAKRRPSRG